MRETRIIMGMPITVDVVGECCQDLIARSFKYFDEVDARFSTYKADSEISAINRGEVSEVDMSPEMREVFQLARKTQRETDGFFDMRRGDGSLDPSGIVKSWAILNAARGLEQAGVENYFIEAGGDIQSRGLNALGEEWRVGIRSPMALGDIVKVIVPKGQGVATSGNYVRGAHIWNPHARAERLDDVLSITVIGPDVLEADRFATAAFAMGRDGAGFIQSLEGFEAYQIDARGRALMTNGFKEFVVQ